MSNIKFLRNRIEKCKIILHMFVFIIFPNQANVYQIRYNVNLFSGLESQKVHFCSLNQVKGNYTSNIVTVSIINNSDK